MARANTSPEEAILVNRLLPFLHEGRKAAEHEHQQGFLFHSSDNVFWTSVPALQQVPRCSENCQAEDQAVWHAASTTLVSLLQERCINRDMRCPRIT